MLELIEAVKSRPHISLASLLRRRRSVSWMWGTVAAVSLACGCSRIHQEHHETVYVSARQAYLHDRVAAVSNRVGEVNNGQRLEILEHGRRFLKVKTDKNQIGWLEEHAVVDSKVYDLFAQLAADHKNDPVVATAVLRDDVYLHILPGRDTEHFLLLPANAKVQLLVRASVPKAAPGSGGGHRTTPLVPKQQPATAPATTPAASGKTGAGSANQAAKPAATPAPVSKAAAPTTAPAEPAPVILEDWWLVRDGQGHAGWLLASRMDVDAPDAIAQYAEGQRIVGAYVLTKIHDDNADTPDHEVPEYVMLLAPMKWGLPYDFDQVRVFTWSRNHHRYETAFRLRPIQGFLPVNITTVEGPGKNAGMVPAFGVKIAADPDIQIDPQTGTGRPSKLRTINFEMLDTVVKRIGPDLDPIPAMHSSEDKKEAKAAKRAGKKRGR